jgi:two-component system response regulator DegU
MPTSLQSRARVVIGDDNDTTLQTISRIVRVQFDVVGTVRDGETAVNSIELLKPDVLVLDVFLPALDGIQVVRRLKALGSPPQVVILTGLEGQAFVDAAMIAGASAFVFKRRMAVDLLLAIREVLAGRIFVSADHPEDIEQRSK